MNENQKRKELIEKKRVKKEENDKRMLLLKTGVDKFNHITTFREKALRKNKWMRYINYRRDWVKIKVVFTVLQEEGDIIVVYRQNTDYSGYKIWYKKKEEI
jgi:hypothetical protein